MASLRGMQQPDLSKKLYKLIKSENHAIGAYETAGRERLAIAQQLSEWGEATQDDAISEISDKLGVLMAEIAEQEDGYAAGLEEYRGVLKQIRNTESSVQPSRDHKAKIADEIAKLKYKEPQSTKIVQLEQELVRAEAQSLVAEAQLTNITRQKFKEAYDIHFAATIERAEKQIILAKQARRMVNLLDDTPIVPGDAHPAFEGGESARHVLNEAEDGLRAWQPNVEPIHSSAGNLGVGAMPGAGLTGPGAGAYGSETGQEASSQEHPAYREKTARSRSGSGERRIMSGNSLGSSGGGGEVKPPYPMTETERREVEHAGVF
ncbi:Eisosome component PIL1-domain-containing protein [Massariosphaeria phaeospora]|uniref:Eisosome component PIL1-domain-containing protein n=1 Tax=Massariosphaeria phaeospora TaxID=100035 RepID=A0A7C8MBN3_9PLEO|nr:Eisosome component PIL1-domain-containing protein [Massariosphaeria phaeospora]